MGLKRRACPDCSIDGTLYNTQTGRWDIPCPKCNGKGELPLTRQRNIVTIEDDIFLAIRKNCVDDKAAKKATKKVAKIFRRFLDDSRENNKRIELIK